MGVEFSVCVCVCVLFLQKFPRKKEKRLPEKKKNHGKYFGNSPNEYAVNRLCLS